jgi:hypothetical protein
MPQPNAQQVTGSSAAKRLGKGPIYTVIPATPPAKLAKLAKLNNNASLAYPLRQWA